MLEDGDTSGTREVGVAAASDRSGAADPRVAGGPPETITVTAAAIAAARTAAVTAHAMVRRVS